MSPLCESYVSGDRLNQMEPFYPLHAYVCDRCWLVQLQEFVSPNDIFTEYAYFSSFSESWLAHARTYTDHMIHRFGLGAHSQVIELASNDGYLLQYFVAQGVPALGIEPAANVAKVAIDKNVPTMVRFFGAQLARELRDAGYRPDLLLGNNVLAQVPDVNDFVAGMKVLLGDTGVITMEFPHLLQLMQQNQFDTIYHEHFSYFSLIAADRIFTAHGLTIFDVDELPTHGGSLRIFARHDEDVSKPISERVSELRRHEDEHALTRIDLWIFADQGEDDRVALLDFSLRQSVGESQLSVTCSGKGNAPKYCGSVQFSHHTVDRNPYKAFTLGAHSDHCQKIAETKPDYLLILP